MTGKPPQQTTGDQTAKAYPCLCAVIRKTGRVLTTKYDAYLKPSGLRVTQYSMLANLARNPGISVGELAGLLTMDQTTVTRNLGVLHKAGLIKMEPAAEDRRVKLITVSAKGQAKLVEARPLWDKAQAEMEGALGESGISGLLASLKKMRG